MYAAYKILTAYLKTHIDWKCGDGKSIPCKSKWKESCSSNTCIRQNRLKKKNVTRDKARCYIIIKRSIQEDITAVNICVLTQEYLLINT